MSKSRTRKFWLEGPGSFVIAVLLALFVRWALFEAYVIPSGSMLPTLLHHDHIFVNKMVYGLRVPFSEDWLFRWGEPKRGDVIVFKFPNDKKLYYIKRVVGLPGDRIYYENGNLYVNETLVEKSVPTNLKSDWDWLSDADFPGDVSPNSSGRDQYVHWQQTLDNHTFSILLRKNGAHALAVGPIVVPQGHYFVLGDNRDNSQDSRAWDAKATVATGKVLVTRTASAGAMAAPVAPGPIVIPKGTVFKTSDSHTLAVQFESTEDVTLKDASIQIPVKCSAPGAQGNVASGAIRFLPPDLAAKNLQVNNITPTSGGEDRRFVPRDYLIGRASFVWLSCEDTLPMVHFMCNPLKVRWNRFFHLIH